MKYYKLILISRISSRIQEHFFKCNKDVTGQYFYNQDVPLDIQLIIEKLDITFGSRDIIEIYNTEITEIEL